MRNTANVNLIKNHIKSVKDTQKITNAMYLIASTKLKKARAELDATEPYFTALQREIKRIFRISSDIDNKYFYPADGEKPHKSFACLVITSDKGLAGAYNKNAIREAEALLATHSDMKFFVVGAYGRHYFEQNNIPMEEEFVFSAQNPTMRRARKICSVLLDYYDRQIVDKIYIIYTDVISASNMSAKTIRLLPFHRKEFQAVNDEKEINTPFEFVPSVEKVLDSIMESYISGYIYSALIDSFCAELNARMTAMDSANKNAEKILESLKLQYNRQRQASITQEITEVTAGAKAQRLKRKKGEKTNEHR